MGCIFFHFGWLRKKNAQKNTSESSLFFLLPSVSQCYPTKFFFQHGMTKNFPPILFCTWGEWNISKVMRLCVHPVGSAWRGRWKSFGWPGGRLQQDVHGVFSLSGWFFWRFIACIFSGWDVHWLMYLKNLPKYTLLRVIYIYIYQWDISRNLDIFFRKQPELQPGSLCERLVRFGDVLTKKNGCFSRSLWVQVCCFLL